jgi:hypothetical protein
MLLLRPDVLCCALCCLQAADPNPDYDEVRCAVMENGWFLKEKQHKQMHTYVFKQRAAAAIAGTATARASGYWHMTYTRSELVCECNCICCCCIYFAAADSQYIISVRAIMQSVMPSTKPASAPPECASYDPTKQTRVWGYGADVNGETTHNWPAFTIEATVRHLQHLSQHPSSVHLNMPAVDDYFSEDAHWGSNLQCRLHKRWTWGCDAMADL